MFRTDRSLLDRCIRKESAAQFELFKLLRDALHSVARRYEHDAHCRRSMVNSAFLKILDKLHTRHPDAPFEAWCRRIMINTVLNDQRDRRTASGPVVPMEVELADNLHSCEMNGAEETIVAEELQQMMDRLPMMTRQVFNLYAVDGWKHREIADELHISEGTSKWHVNHARTLLQAMLAQEHRSIHYLQHA